MMKLVFKIIGGLLALLVFLFVVQGVASESGEVVVVQTLGAHGEAEETRLWVVDLDGQQYLRSGSPMAAWYQRMQANPSVQIQRGDLSFTATSVPKPELRTQINQLMNEKYGWADDLIGVMFGRDDAIPILLQR